MIKKAPLRVLFFGNPGYGGETLKELMKQDVQIVGVFHQSRNKLFKFKQFIKYNLFKYEKFKSNLHKLFYSNRGKKILESFIDERRKIKEFKTDVELISRKKNIKLFEPSVFFNKKYYKYFKSLNIDVILVASYSYLIPSHLINCAKLSAINFHTSLLPRYRGPNPEFCAIYNQEKKTGITYHLLNNKFDQGNIILQESIKIHDNDTTLSLSLKLSHLGKKLLKKLIKLLSSKKRLITKTQNEKLATYCKLPVNFDLIKKKFKIKQVKKIINAFKGYRFEPYCMINNNKLYILSYNNKKGLSFTFKDGRLKFDIIRYNGKIYKGRNLNLLKNKFRL